jgi:sterol desaturase/sphingolipid hydroxylase (fatty acid hydroxylase superfamily)
VFDLILHAIPVFLLLLVVEAIAFRIARHDADAPDAPLGYDARDTRTSLIMGVGTVVVNFGWKGVVLALLAATSALSPLSIPAGAWWAWVLLFFADDLAMYCAHRAGHRVRLFWASHVVHHSSQRYNLSTALRQTWTPMYAVMFWLPLAAIGFEPWMILLAQAWNLVYQFWIHTERIGRLPRFFEAVFNTPSHHRVHHGSNAQYLDRNYGGILIVWDRLLGTFEPEGERVRYGLTTNIETYNPVRVAFHEYGAIARDLRAARGWRERAGYLLRGPGWVPRGAAPAAARVPAPPVPGNPPNGRASVRRRAPVRLADPPARAGARRRGARGRRARRVRLGRRRAGR